MAILSLVEANQFLQITTDTANSEVIAKIAEAVAVVERRCGPIDQVSVTETVEPFADALQLRRCPVLSLVSVADADGVAVDVSALWLVDDGGPGVLRRRDGALFTSLYYTVSYVAGRDSCPDDLRSAVKEMLKYLWRSQRGVATRADDGEYDPLARANMLMAPHELAGFA